MSVTRLISMPGEISTKSDASPASGRKPCAIVPKKAAYCGCSESRNTYERRSTAISLVFSLGRCATGLGWHGRPAGFLNDLHTGTSPDTRGARRDHLLDTLEITDATRGLDAEPRADRLAHQGDVVHGRAARAKTSRC